MAKTAIKKLSKEEQKNIIDVLQVRFKENPSRHKGILWEHVEKKIVAHPQKLWSLREMEKTGGNASVW